MMNEESWNTFTRTGRVEDYLNYREAGWKGDSAGNGYINSRRGGERERTSEGDGALGSSHW